MTLYFANNNVGPRISLTVVRNFLFLLYRSTIQSQARRYFPLQIEKNYKNALSFMSRLIIILVVDIDSHGPVAARVGCGSTCCCGDVGDRRRGPVLDVSAAEQFFA